MNANFPSRLFVCLQLGFLIAKLINRLSFVSRAYCRRTLVFLLLSPCAVSAAVIANFSVEAHFIPSTISETITWSSPYSGGTATLYEDGTLSLSYLSSLLIVETERSAPYEIRGRFLVDGNTSLFFSGNLAGDLFSDISQSTVLSTDCNVVEATGTLSGFSCNTENTVETAARVHTDTIDFDLNLGSSTLFYLEIFPVGEPSDPALISSFYSIELTTTSVPVPAALYLFVSGLLGMVGVKLSSKGQEIIGVN